jgi:CCR4-NOT transcription complex subunit 3
MDSLSGPTPSIVLEKKKTSSSLGADDAEEEEEKPAAAKDKKKKTAKAAVSSIPMTIGRPVGKKEKEKPESKPVSSNGSSTASSKPATPAAPTPKSNPAPVAALPPGVGRPTAAQAVANAQNKELQPPTSVPSPSQSLHEEQKVAQQLHRQAAQAPLPGGRLAQPPAPQQQLPPPPPQPPQQQLPPKPPQQQNVSQQQGSQQQYPAQQVGQSMPSPTAADVARGSPRVRTPDSMAAATQDMKLYPPTSPGMGGALQGKAATASPHGLGVGITPRQEEKSSAGERDISDMLNHSMACLPLARDSDRLKQYVPRNPYNAPSQFPTQPSPLFENPAFFSKLSTDTLFFIFYYQQGTYQQYLAAK